MNNTTAHLRLKQKIDTLENWSATTLTLLEGEIAIVVMPNGDIRVKVGNGTSSFDDLPYVNDNTTTIRTWSCS